MDDHGGGLPPARSAAGAGTAAGAGATSVVDPDAKVWGVKNPFSAAPACAELVETHECRTARQLSTLVGRLLPV